MIVVLHGKIALFNNLNHLLFVNWVFMLIEVWGNVIVDNRFHFDLLNIFSDSWICGPIALNHFFYLVLQIFPWIEFNIWSTINAVCIVSTKLLFTSIVVTNSLNGFIAWKNGGTDVLDILRSLNTPPFYRTWHLRINIIASPRRLLREKD